MAAGPAHPVLRFIRALSPTAGQDVPDAELLGRFVARRDESAFAALVCRHGPMVFGVCARVLGDTPDAEDAFQATFLVLVRRAGSMGRPDLLGNWLHGVAYRTALKARAETLRRRRQESHAAARPPVDAAEEGVWRDLRPILDEELNRLPQKYRVPLVLCHLEGQTHEEAARRLGCPRETVTTRLVRARERLRSRMVRRGLTLSAAALAGQLAEDALAGAVPAPLAQGTIQAAMRFAAGPMAAAGVISARVAALTEGVLQTMFLTKLKIAAAALLGVGVVAWGLAAFAQAKPGAVPAATTTAASVLPSVLEAAEPGQRQGRERTASVKDMPPVVVQTAPRAGDTEVDASTTTEIRVTFSKDMADKSWSWSQISDNTYPKTTGKAHYDKDHRTCILPVKLEPGKTYVIWLNPEKFQGFRDTDGRPAVFYPLAFETKP
jgi:RNA polymerase sigma-70 factor (ECF subfamily)